jgi:hypothetical protein
MNTVGKWIWKVLLFIYLFSFHYSVVNRYVEISISAILFVNLCLEEVL